MTKEYGEQMKKILITGCSGYIGSHLLKKIESRFKSEIHGLDKTPSTLPLEFFYHADILNLNNLKNKPHFDCVIHLAAEMKVSESVKNPILYYETNINGTLNVLRNIKTKNFIFASTGAVETLSSPYGISKKCGEEVVAQYCEEHNIDYTIFRFYNVIGQDGIETKNQDGLFHNLLKSKDTGIFNVFGSDYDTPDGTCVRDYVHVYEICEAIIKAVETPSLSIENLGHGKGCSVLEMINKFIITNNFFIKIQFKSRRKGDIPYSVLDKPSKYIEKLFPIEEILKL